MSEPISLNKVRKERAKVAKRQKADENAVRFGRTKAEKARDEAQAKRQSAHIDGHHRDEDI